MDSQELAETALEAIDEWLDEDIVDFKPDEGQNAKIPGFMTPEMTSIINKKPIRTAQLICFNCLSISCCVSSLFMIRLFIPYYFG